MKTKTAKSRHLGLRSERAWLKFTFPAIFFVTLFMLYPVVYSLFLSLFKHKGLKSTFVGLSNYIELFQDSVFRKSLGNTLLFLIVQVPVMLCLGLLFAYILQTKNLRFRNFFRMALFVPCITSAVAYSIVFRTLFQVDGMVNQALMGLNVISEPIPWLTETGWARVLVIIALCWRWTGYNAMYYIAGLQNIPKDIIEAACIDGVNPIQEFFRIIVPQLKQMIIFTSITSTIGTLQLFDEIVNLTKGGPSNGTLTVAYYTYNMSFANNNNFGYSAAISWVVVIIIAVLSLIQLKTTKEDG